MVKLVQILDELLLIKESIALIKMKFDRVEKIQGIAFCQFIWVIMIFCPIIQTMSLTCECAPSLWSIAYRYRDIRARFSITVRLSFPVKVWFGMIDIALMNILDPGGLSSVLVLEAKALPNARTRSS